MTGLKLVCSSSGLAMTFFNRGVTRAFFIADGTFPVESEALTILHSIGARKFAHFFSNHVRIGSDAHCLDGDILTDGLISSMVTGPKCEQTYIICGKKGYFHQILLLNDNQVSLN